MKEEYVTYKCAVKLKELGFDWKCDHFWHKEFTDSDKMVLRQASADDFNHDDWDVPHYSAPALHIAQKWIREKGIHISANPYMGYDVDADGELYNEYPSWGFELMDVASADFMDDAGGNHTSYELALSAGIDKALGLLTLNTK